ncbi:MAG: hypothetical protein K2M41_05190 [Muribaculaceae bacterium]|nr:hypothetical protein [Muribaculaceae bacterium]
MLSIGGVLFMLMSMTLLTSCFTGIEGTKAITMSKGEAKESLPTPEERYLMDINSTPEKDWPVGKEFVVADSKAVLLMDARKIVSSSAELVAGDTLRYIESRYITLPDGRKTPAVSFDRAGDVFEYTSRNGNRNIPHILSDEIPGVIDLEMVNRISDKLKGNRYWTLSKLWDDANGNRTEGKKFIPVTITDVRSGNMIFPYLIEFVTDDGLKGYYALRLDAKKDSHTFSNMFSFSDPRKLYNGISDQTWQLICSGEVKSGMTKDEVRISKGLPSDVRTGHDYSRALLLWNYPDGMVLYFEDGILTGINTYPN